MPNFTAERPNSRITGQHFQSPKPSDVYYTPGVHDVSRQSRTQSSAEQVAFLRRQTIGSIHDVKFPGLRTWMLSKMQSDTNKKPSIEYASMALEVDQAQGQPQGNAISLIIVCVKD